MNRHLSANQLSSLPAEIGNLSDLQVLSLGGNALSSLPPAIGNLSNLCALDLGANRFQSIPLELAPLKRLGTLEQCAFTDSGRLGLSMDETLLDSLPATVVSGGTTAILDYLENAAGWHFQRLLAGGVSSLGFVAAGILVWRWRNRRGKRKRKPAALV